MVHGSDKEIIVNELYPSNGTLPSPNIILAGYECTSGEESTRVACCYSVGRCVGLVYAIGENTELGRLVRSGKWKPPPK